MTYTVQWKLPDDGNSAAEGILLYMYAYKDGVLLDGPIWTILPDASEAEMRQRAKKKIKELEDIDALNATKPKPKKVKYEKPQDILPKISGILNVDITK